MNKKVILVTGSNKGIGFEIVRQLSGMGHTVILTSRNESKGKEAINKLKMDNLTAHLLKMDIADEADIKRAADHVKSTFGHLDVLINNAAILLKDDRSLLHDSSAIYDTTLQTNAYAQLLVSRLFLPLMPGGSRIVMTSSGGGRMTDPIGGWSPAYCVSKTLVNSITRHLAFELADRKIKVNAYCPGWVRTDMGGMHAPRSAEQGADTAVWLATGSVNATGKFFRDRTEIPW